MQGVLAEVPADGMIWVLGGSRAPIDLAEVVLLTHRSDVLVQGVAGIADTWSKRVDPGAPEEWVLLLGEVRTGALSARSWPAFVGQVEDMGGTELFRIGKLSAR